jgi:hypothetical protein
MDSPTFRRESDGHAMVSDKIRQFKSQYGLERVVHPSRGFLTFETLERMADAARLHGRFVPSKGPLLWRLRRAAGRGRLGRAPAAFGLWVAE